MQGNAQHQKQINHENGFSKLDSNLGWVVRM